MIDWSLNDAITEYFQEIQKIKYSLCTKKQYMKYKEEADAKLIKRYENLKRFCLKQLTVKEMQMINSDVGFNLIDKADIDRKMEEL